MAGKELEPRKSSDELVRVRETLAGLPVSSLTPEEQQLVMETQANLHAIEELAKDRGIVPTPEDIAREQRYKVTQFRSEFAFFLFEGLITQVHDGEKIVWKKGIAFGPFYEKRFARVQKKAEKFAAKMNSQDK